jgi:Tol biopolymer transport system component
MRYARLRGPLAIAAGSGALAVGVAATGATAGSASRTGAIADAQELAYVSASRLELGVVNADGSGRKRLTRCQSASVCRIGELAWSPGGGRIAFYRGLWHRNMSLFVVNAGGSRLKRLGLCGIDCRRPSWASDGSAIAFSRGESIFIVTTRNAKMRRLTRCGPPTCSDASPAWSAKGRIVFARRDVSGTTLYVVDPANASRLTELAKLPKRAANIAWSPDRMRIAYDVSDGASDSVRVVDVDGSDPTVLVSGPTGSGPGMPSWSPDGTSIAYFNTPRAANGFFETEVWTVRRDGTGPRRLFHADCCLSNWVPPSWTADGTEVAFAYSGTSGTPTGERVGGTFLLSTDGSGVRRPGEAVSELAPKPTRR